MSLPATINQTILNTILSHLALLFLTAAADPEQARHAAADALSGYNIQTEEELRLAAEIISFGFHALQALAQAAEPELSANTAIRLRGSAVSLSRQAHQAQRKLDQLQRARRAEPQQPPAAEPAVAPTATNEEPARTFAEAERVAQQIIANDGVKRWSPAGQKRAMALRMAEKAKQNAARYNASLEASNQTAAQTG